MTSFKDLKDVDIRKFLNEAFKRNEPERNKPITMFTGFHGMIIFDMNMKYGDSFNFKHYVFWSKHMTSVFSLGTKHGMYKVVLRTRPVGVTDWRLTEGTKVLIKTDNIDDLIMGIKKLGI